MSSIDYLPKAYGALLSWLLNFMNYVMANLSRFNIIDTDVIALQGLINEFQTAHTAAEAPNAGRADSLRRKEAAVLVEKAVRTFVNEHLRYNRNVTDDDRLLLGLTVPDTTRTPSPVPVTQPTATIDTSLTMRLNVHYKDATTESHAKPAGVHGAEILWVAGDATPPEISGLVNSAFSTRTPHLFEFDESQRGRTFWARLRWENMLGQKGPWSELYSAIIP